MQVRDQMVKRKKKQHSEPEAGECREERELAQCRRLLNCRDQQASYRSGHHHPCGKPGKRTLDQIAKRAFHKEHAGRTGSRSEKGDQYSEKNLHRFTVLYV